ncbi:polysialyltransferase family glycosyltransferase [Demequina maris]|uniref:polysialyltransferase family glycosyltransferase n=1 Tax=Demequina maris TaxID=1638982 RepID=UPI000783F952|nr:polysialyltransferase family glycosyltransferase [Demequina maris]
MPQLFSIATAYGAVTAAAAIDAGLVPEGRGERILVVHVGAPVPEIVTPFYELEEMKPVLARFDRVIELNPLTSPYLPQAWSPRWIEMPMWRRLLRSYWDLGDGDVELYLQNLQVPPSTSLAMIFDGGPITVIGDGLMSYSPIRMKIPYSLTSRLTTLIYQDVLPGIRPVLFSEHDIALAPVTPEPVRRLFEEIADACDDPQFAELVADTRPTGLVLGQYLSELGLMSRKEERDTLIRMVNRAVAMGGERIVFKPHPSAPPMLTAQLAAAAEKKGVDFVVYESSTPAEAFMARANVVAVVAGFSTAIPSAAALFGLPVDSIGNKRLAKRLSPYENSNRIPVTVVDAMTRPDSPYASTEQLQRLIDAVGYCMQPQIAGHLREDAVELVGSLDEEERERYFDGGRLGALDLPGGTGIPTQISRAARHLGWHDAAGDLRKGASVAKARAKKVARAAGGK